MSPKGKTTKGRLLSVGLDTLSTVGLAGVTLGDLATKAHMSKSGLFAHFSSKEQLQLDLLDEMVRVADANVVAPAMAVAEGLPRLSALFTNWIGWSTRAGLRGGCPVAAAIFELDDLSGIVRDRVAELDARWRSLLTSLVTESIDRGHFQPNVDVEQFVWELFGIYLSHHASSRFIRDPKADTRARMAFSSLIERAGAHVANSCKQTC
jgi:AcrR family transcriptional regulator